VKRLVTIQSRERRTTMKRKICVLLSVLLLTLALAVPASASKPSELSGRRWINAPPQNRVWRPAGNNCVVEVDITYEYEGDLVGTSASHFRIVSHGPCGPSGPLPYKYHETLHIRGTFTGEVLGVPGSFDFIETAKNWPEDSHKAEYGSRLVVLSGAGDLAGLHGMLDIVSGDYSGRIHFDPQP
jgi:hypothetical protein